MPAASNVLHHVDRGQGPPLLFVHGFPLDHSMWDDPIYRFSATYRVIAPDLRGFGAGLPAGDVTTMEQMADDLLALLDSLAIHEPVSCCGLSMGGYVLFSLWRRYRQRVGALALCDTRAAADSEEARAGRHKLRERVLSEGTEPLADAMLGKLFSPQTAKNRPQLVDTWRRKILAVSPQGAGTALLGMAQRPDSQPLLPEISCPTLVMVGEQDAISTPPEMRSIADAIPKATFATIPDSGHMTPLENPLAFNAVLESFLARVHA